LTSEPPRQRFEGGDDLALGEPPASIYRQTLVEALAIRRAGRLQQARASQLADRLGVQRVLWSEALESGKRCREDRLRVARTAGLVQHAAENHSRVQQLPCRVR
jgi:hypothetical protein